MKRLITKTIDFNGEHSTSKSLGLKKTKRGFDQHMICAFYRKIWELMNDFFSICSRKVGGTWPAQIDDATQQMYTNVDLNLCPILIGMEATHVKGLKQQRRVLQQTTVSDLTNKMNFINPK